MAIDTRTKRASCIGAGRPWMRTKEPDATKVEEWRISSGNAYGGNALSPGTGVAIPIAAYHYNHHLGSMG